MSNWLEDKMSSWHNSISGLTQLANNTTGESDSNIGDAVASLIAGYGGGGSSVPFGVESITTTDYTHAEDWLTDETGNGLKICQTYAPGATGEEHLYIVVAIGNTASQYKFDAMNVYSATRGNYAGWSWRQNYSNALANVGSSRSLRISAGTTIRVTDIKLKHPPRAN